MQINAIVFKNNMQEKIHIQINDLKSLDFQSGAALLIDKPLLWTSFDVVNKIRSQFKYKLGIPKIKVGHAGTLDPMATDRKSTRLNSSHVSQSRMPSSA